MVRLMLLSHGGIAPYDISWTGTANGIKIMQLLMMVEIIQSVL